VQARIDSLSLGATLAGLSGPYGGSGGNAQGGHSSGLFGPRSINESGQEVMVRGGATVIPVGPTRNNMMAGGQAAQPLVVQLTLDGRTVAQSVIRNINADTRANGGRSRLKNTPYYADLR